MTTEQLKRLSEKRHRMVQRYLQREFPNCFVSYNGVEGVDHIIKYYESLHPASGFPELISETTVETKTCQGIISGGINYELTTPDHPYTFTIPRLGRFKFDLRPAKPYTFSQHQDLAVTGGWYVFVIGDNFGNNIITGIRADGLNLNGKTIKKLSWSTILKQCYPDWLARLKHQIYCTNENHKKTEENK